MALPFSPAQFFDVFAQYNEAIWPLQWFLSVGAVVTVAMTLASPRLSRLGGVVLAFLWAWIAIAYHFVFFTKINPAAWVFGAAALVASAVFSKHTLRGTLQFGQARGGSRAAGLGLVIYALVAYPLLGSLAGHAYPRMPTFGLPCPTTIFTLGMLLLAKAPVPASVWVVPFAWSVVGTTAAFQLGVIQDYGLAGAAMAAAAVLIVRRRNTLAHE